MKDVYLVQHSYEVSGFDETKLIGIYKTRERAEEAVEKSRKLTGFEKYPDSFYIEKYELDIDHWTEGFISWEEALGEADNEQ